MTARFTKLTLLSLTVAGVGLTACGPGEKDGDAQPIEHSTARQALIGNSQELAARISTNLEFLEQSRLVSDMVGVAVAEESAPCADFDTCPEPVAADVEIDTDITDDTDQALTELELRVLNDASIETQTETSITYLVDGALACDQDGTADPQCVSEVDAMEIRLVVTSPAEGDVDVDLLVGPSRAKPATFNVHKLMLGLTVDLGEVKTAAAHFASVTGDDIDLPTTFQGKVSGRIQAEGASSVMMTTSVDQAVKIADGDFSVAVAATPMFWAMSADASTKTLGAQAGIKSIDADFPISTYSYDVDTDVETEVTYRLGLHLAGAEGAVELNADSDVVTATGISLGDDTSTLSIDGTQVLGIDINSADGRSFDATIAADGDTTTVEVTPAFDLRAEMNFAAAGDAYGETADWTLDDVLHIRLDGAAAPKVRMGDQMEVLAGQLFVEMEKSGESMTATAGQCVLESDVLVSGDGSGTVDATLLGDLEVGACP